MPAAPTSKAVLAVPSVGERWHQKRLHRRLDDRDSVLESSIQLVEEWDSAVFPIIARVSGFQPDLSEAASNVVVAIGGSGCVSTDTITATLGGTTVPAGDITKGTNSITLTGARVKTILTALAAGAAPVLAIRINNVLCPPVLLPVIVA